MAARGKGGTAEWEFVRGDGGVVFAVGPIYRAASGLFFREYAGARIYSAGQSGDLGTQSLCERSEFGLLHRRGEVYAGEGAGERAGIAASIKRAQPLTRGCAGAIAGGGIQENKVFHA